MYYKVKVWSIEDNTQKKSFYYQDNDPLVNEKIIADECRKYVDYQVKVEAFTSRPRKCNKVLAWSGIITALRKVKFYTIKTHEVEDWMTISTFYREQPFDIETQFFYGEWYTFCKRPNYTCTSITDTLIDEGFEVHFSKYGDPYIRGMKLSFSYDGFGHVHLNKLMGTHTESYKEQLYE